MVKAPIAILEEREKRMKVEDDDSDLLRLNDITKGLIIEENKNCQKDKDENKDVSPDFR